jgi:hypothetical protein
VSSAGRWPITCAPISPSTLSKWPSRTGRARARSSTGACTIQIVVCRPGSRDRRNAALVV